MCRPPKLIILDMVSSESPTGGNQDSIGHPLTQPVGRPPKEVRRYHASFSYQAGTWDKARRVVAKVEWHPGELYPRVRLDPLRGFIVTNLSRLAKARRPASR